MPIPMWSRKIHKDWASQQHLGRNSELRHRTHDRLLSRMNYAVLFSTSFPPALALSRGCPRGGDIAALTSRRNLWPQTQRRPPLLEIKPRRLPTEADRAPSKTQSLSCSGARLDVLVKETGWQKHSVRGFLAGTVRKKLKLPLVSEKIDGVRSYRIGTAKAARINKAKRNPTAQKG
jgi:Protein of unknown function (DUF3489)